MNLKNVISVAALLTLIGCGQTSNDIEDAPSTASSFLGSWQRSCYADGAAGVTDRIVFAGDEAPTAEWTTNSYGDTSCAAGELLTIRYTGTVVFSPRGVGSNLDADSVQVFFTPRASAIVDSFNSSTYCGFNDWVIDVQKNVTGRDCGGTVMPSRFYSILNAEGNQLSVGKLDVAHDGTAPAKRPVEFDTRTYSRSVE